MSGAIFVQNCTKTTAGVPDQQDSNYGKYAALGLEMAVGVGLGCLVGWWLDKKYGWAPWGITVGALIGFAAGMYLLLREGFKANRD